MQSRIDWPGLCNDWAASGLSKQRYFLSTRIERFVRYGVLPGFSAVMHHLAAYEKSSTETDKVSAQPHNEPAIIHHLNAQDVRAALSGVGTYGDDSAVNNHVTLVLANGTTIEFEAENAERFALQALSLGRLE